VQVWGNKLKKLKSHNIQNTLVHFVERFGDYSVFIFCVVFFEITHLFCVKKLHFNCFQLFSSHNSYYSNCLSHNRKLSNELVWVYGNAKDAIRSLPVVLGQSSLLYNIFLRLCVTVMVFYYASMNFFCSHYILSYNSLV